MSLTKFEQRVQDRACTAFPAQELWSKNDKFFRAYKVTPTTPNHFKISEVNGKADGQHIIWNSSTHEEYGDSRKYIEHLCRRYRKDGFNCFASLF